MMLIKTFIFFSVWLTVATCALLPHPHRLHIKHDYTFERNCFFSPAQCLLGNFPKSSNLQPMLNVFEDKSLTKIYSKMLSSHGRPAFFGSRK